MTQVVPTPNAYRNMTFVPVSWRIHIACTRELPFQTDYVGVFKENAVEQFVKKLLDIQKQLNQHLFSLSKVERKNKALLEWVQGPGQDLWTAKPETWYRVIASVRDSPNHLTSLEEFSKLHGVGPKVLEIMREVPWDAFQRHDNDRMMSPLTAEQQQQYNQ